MRKLTDLGDEEHGGSLVQGSAIAVNVGAQRDHELHDGWAALEVDSTLHGHGHGGCTRGRSKAHGKGREVTPVAEFQNTRLLHQRSSVNAGDASAPVESQSTCHVCTVMSVLAGEATSMPYMACWHHDIV